MTTVNGTAAAFLRPPISKGYVPRVFGIYNWYNESRPWFRMVDVEQMRRDPKIRLGIRVLRAPIRRAKWTIKSNSPAVRQFVDSQLKHVWKCCLGRLLKMLDYGYCPGEWEYGREEGLIVIRDLIDFHPFDADPLQIDGKIVGLRIRNQHEDMRIGSPRYLWLVNEPEYDRYRGLSRLANAWTPWMEKTGRHGACESRRLWFLKNAYRGSRIRYPQGSTQRGEGDFINNDDLAREIVEKMETGGIIGLPNDRDGKGDYAWAIEDPQINGDAEQVLRYPKDVDLEILDGMGIPPEVIQTTGDSGSGYMGRSVPAQAFYSSEDDVVITVIDGVERSAIWPMVRANFGKVKYEIEVEPLLGQEPQQGQGAGEGDNSNTKPAIQLPGLGNRTSEAGDPRSMALSLTVADEARRRVERIPVMNLSVAATPHKFSSTQFDLTEPLASYVRKAAAQIPDDLLAEDGRETDPHITIKYGLHTNDFKDVERIVAGFGPVQITIGDVSKFPEKDGSGYEVVKLDIDSLDLRRLNKLLSVALPHTDTHPTYQPHITLAYVKPCGDRFSRDTVSFVSGTEHVFDTLIFSNQHGEQTAISLTMQ